MEESDIDIRGVLALLWRQKRLIFVTVFASLTLACAVIFFLPPAYSASALILVDPSRKNLLDPEVPTTSSAADSARIDSEVEILESESLIQRLVQEQNLASDPEFGTTPDWHSRLLAALKLGDLQLPSGDEAIREATIRLRKSVSIQRRGLTNLISVQVRSGNPQKAADMANALVEIYISEQLRSKISNTLTTRDVLQSHTAQARGTIIESENALNLFIADHLEQITNEANATGMMPIPAQTGALNSKTIQELKLAQSSLPAGNLPADQLIRLYELQQGADLAREQYRTLLARVNELSTQADLQVADSRIISPAMVPASPSFPDARLILLLAGLSALALGIALAFLYENFIGGFTSEEQIEAVLKMPVGAAIPGNKQLGGQARMPATRFQAW